MRRFYSCFLFQYAAEWGLILFGLLGLFGCGASVEPAVENRLAALATVEPVAYFLRAVGGDFVTVEVLVPAGREAETYAPTPSDIQKLALCRIFFRVGLVSEEPLLARLRTLNPKMEIVDLRENLALHGDEHHDESHEHRHGEPCGCGDGLDPHLWMSPEIMKTATETIAKRFSRLDSAHAADFQRSAAELVERLDDLSDLIQRRLAGLSHRTIYVFHPAYGYYCRQFGLEQRAIEADGKAPKPRELADWIRRAGEERVRTIIVQPEFGPSAIQAICESLPVRSAVHSPLEADYFENLRRLTELIAVSQESSESEQSVSNTDVETAKEPKKE